MAIKLGNLDISSFKVGSVDVDAIYLGNTLVYSGGTPPTPTYEWVSYSAGDTVPSSTVYGVKLYVDYENSWEIDFGVDSGIAFSYENNDWIALDIETYEQIDISSYFDDGEGCYIILFSDLGYGGLTIYSPEPEVETFECDIDLYEESQPTPPAHDYSQDYLTFVATESGTFTFTPENSNVISYSTDDGSTWTQGNSVSVNANDKVLWKGTMTPQTSKGIGSFSSTANFIVEGNDMSLLFGDNFQNQTDLTGKKYAFYKLFSGCTTITSAENLILPATTLDNNCYRSMFQECSNLTTAPSTLPATTLANNCYMWMFGGCTSLTTATSLPATTLAIQCYHSMFYGCTSLTTAPSTLPATTLATNCYYQMFYGCTSLTTAPSLPATTLAQACYYWMFYYCFSLTSITCLAIDISANSCTENWAFGVASSGTFIKNPSMTSWSSGNSGIPNGWTVQDYSS